MARNVKIPNTVLGEFKNLKRRDAAFRHLTPAQFRKAIKKLWIGTMTAWHSQLAEKHFEVEGYTEYSEVYSGYRQMLSSRRKNTAPLVVTGHFKRQVLKRSQRSNISGTSKGARMKILYGRPRGQSVEKLDGIAKGIYYKARKERRSSVLVNGRTVPVDLQKIRNAIFRNKGYSTGFKRRVQKMISYVSRAEQRQLALAGGAALKQYVSIPDFRRSMKVSL